MSKEKGQSIKLTTPKFRASFANVWKPKPGYRNSEPVYSVEMLFSKKEDITWLKKAIAAAADSEWGSKEKRPKDFKNPLKDGDTKELEGYAGHYFITCKSKNKPGIVDKGSKTQGPQEIIEPSEFYSGCYARATVVVKAYSGANNGVSIYLQNLQKLEDGPAFSGRTNAKDDFEVIEDFEDSGSNSQTADDLDF